MIQIKKRREATAEAKKILISRITLYDRITARQ